MTLPNPTLAMKLRLMAGQKYAPTHPNLGLTLTSTMALDYGFWPALTWTNWQNTWCKKHVLLLGRNRSSPAACCRSDKTSPRSRMCWSDDLGSCRCQNHRTLPTLTFHSTLYFQWRRQSS